MRTFMVMILLAAAMPARAESVWEIDPAHSSVQFSVRHMMVSNVRGAFTKVAGTVRGEEEDAAHATVEATIDTASIVDFVRSLSSAWTVPVAFVNCPRTLLTIM